MAEIVSICLFSFIWLVSIYIHFKKKGWDIANTIMFVYFFSSLTSIYFYFNVPVGHEVDNITLPPLLYLFMAILICIFPLLRYGDRIENISLTINKSQGHILYLIICMISPFVILAFGELSILCYESNSISIVDSYSDETFSIGKQMSRIGRVGYTISHFGAYIWPTIFFYIISNTKYRILAFVSLIAFANEILQGYASGDRVTLVRFVLYFFIVFYLVKNMIETKVRKRILIFAFSVILIVVSALLLITIARFDNISSDYSMGGFVTLYSGEGCLRFSQYIWDLNVTSNGDTCFSFFKYILGFDTYTDNFLRRLHYESIFKIPTYIFYTFVGDFYQDLGIVGTILFCIFLAYFLKKIIFMNVKNKGLSLLPFFILTIFLQIYLFGFMYYNFKTFNDQLQLIAPIVLFGLLDRIKH